MSCGLRYTFIFSRYHSSSLKSRGLKVYESTNSWHLCVKNHNGIRLVDRWDDLLNFTGKLKFIFVVVEREVREYACV